jgi:hypothetical protein
MKTPTLIVFSILLVTLRSSVLAEGHSSEGIAAEMRRAEKEDAEAKRAAAVAAEIRRKEDATRVANIKEAARMQEEALRLVDDLAAKRAETETLKIELSSKLAAHAAERARLGDDKAQLEKAAEKLEFRQAVFSSSVIGLLLTNLFTVYQLVASRRNRRLEDRKLQLEIDLLQQKLEDHAAD